MIVVEVKCCLLTHTTTGGGAVPALDCCVTFPEFITAASKKLGVHQIWIVFGLGFVTTAFLFFGFGAGLLWCVLGAVVDRGALLTRSVSCAFVSWLVRRLSNMVGFIYPAYMSFKAIESEDKSDDTVW